MTNEQMRTAAIAAIDALLQRPETVAALGHACEAEAERVRQMLKRREQGHATFLDSGDIAHTERHFPAISAGTLWALIMRGSDINAGSVKGGYAERHPPLAEAIK